MFLFVLLFRHNLAKWLSWVHLLHFLTILLQACQWVGVRFGPHFLQMWLVSRLKVFLFLCWVRELVPQNWLKCWTTFRLYNGCFFFCSEDSQTLIDSDWRSVSNDMFSRANFASLTCIRHFSHLIGGSVVARSQNRSVDRDVFQDSRATDCACPTGIFSAVI